MASRSDDSVMGTSVQDMQVLDFGGAGQSKEVFKCLCEPLDFTAASGLPDHFRIFINCPNEVVSSSKSTPPGESFRTTTGPFKELRWLKSSTRP